MDSHLDDYRVEVVLARILADWKDARAIGYLLQSLRFPDDGAVSIAAEGLLVFSDNEHVIDALREMLGDPEPRNRLTAAKILSRARTLKAVEVLAARFKEESDKETRALLLLGIMESRYPHRRQFLIDALVDGDLAIRQLAWQGLQDYPNLPKVAYDPDGPLEERARDVAELRLWQKKTR
jgi:HEAT repeat protein